MKRIEKIRHYIFECYEKSPQNFSGCTASNIAEYFSIHRNDASSDLNKLVKQGVLYKTNHRPVLFFPKTAPQDPEPITDSALPPSPEIQSAHVNAESIQPMHKLAMAAVSYPPHGLNTLITGETGVGKNYLAEKMWQYAKDNNTFKVDDPDSIPFVSFNCAEYADNPQLLLSQLFGHKKGAFTGANESKIGLVEQANHGILFLDEVHRLPASGQELLFSLMDKGSYKRLGDETERFTEVMIICATTEDIKRNLLSTFLRRIPVIINIPNLSERSQEERYSLIKNFFLIESKRISHPIKVSAQVIAALLSFKPEGNIGELRNTINLCCAKCYLNFLSNTQEAPGTSSCLTISFHDLPQKCYTERSAQDSQPHYTDVIFYPEEDHTTFNATLHNKYSMNLYSFIEKKLESYEALNLNPAEIKSRVSLDLNNYYNNIVNRLIATPDTTSNSTPLADNIFSLCYTEVANKIFKAAETALNRNYSDSIKTAFALHIQHFIARYNSGDIIYNPDLERIKTICSDEFQLLKEIYPEISTLLNVAISDDELGFWAMFIRQGAANAFATPHIGLMIISHGNSIASDMANTTNQLMSIDWVHAINAPLDEKVSSVYEQIFREIKQIDMGKGVLVLTDMGTFMNIERKIIDNTGVNCRVIPNVSSVLILESVKNILSNTMDLDTVFRYTYKEYIQYTTDIFHKKMQEVHVSPTPQPETTPPKTIITFCTTGYGSAASIRQLLLKIYDSSENINILSLGINDDIQLKAKELGDRLILVIGGIDPKLPNVPFLNASYLFTENGETKIKSIIQLSDRIKKEDFNIHSMDEIFDLIELRCSYFAPSLQPAIIMPICKTICVYLEHELHFKEKPENYYPCLIIHLLCMFERIYTNNPSEFPEWGTSIINKNPHLFDVTKNILINVCEPIHIEIPDSEICYLLQLI